jgi:iron(II)-dependent oxidoreductase
MGFNDTCALGMFPKGESTFHGLDMCGQVWEWTTTLWGEKMDHPDLPYPYTDKDGREDLSADGAIRRVLRGGSFSSPASKTNCTYRGSLEPSGFWRGDGFRIVVSKIRK